MKEILYKFIDLPKSCTFTKYLELNMMKLILILRVINFICDEKEVEDIMSNKNEINLKDKERIQELIKSSLELFKGPNQQLGNSYLTGELNLTEFERKSYILGKLLDKEDNYNLKSKLNGLQFSHGLKDNRYFNPLQNILKEMKRDQISENDLIEIFLGKLDDYLATIKNKPLIEYTLIFPINLKCRNGIPDKFLKKHEDISIQLVPQINDFSETIWDYTNAEFPSRRNFMDKNKKVRDLISKLFYPDTHYFVIKVYGRNIGYAVKKAAYNLNINVGLYAFAIYRGYGVKSFGMGPFPSEGSITKIKIPLVYVLKNNECENILFTFYEEPSGSEDISQNHLALIEDIISFLQEIKDNKLYILLTEAFANYYDALQTSSYSISFLKFWNIIERLLLHKKGINLTEITTRLNSTYPEIEPSKKDIQDLINILVRKRNLFVHESEDKISSDDKDFMKIMVEHVILTLINLRFEFDDIGMLEFFYQNLRKPLRVIKKDFKVLELIEKIKSQENED